MTGHSQFLVVGTRWALLAAPLLMGVALLAGVLSMYRTVLSASNTVLHGQAAVLFEKVRFLLFTVDGAPDQPRLEVIVDELSEEGLVALAIVRPRGEVELTAGSFPPQWQHAAFRRPRGAPVQLDTAQGPVAIVTLPGLPRRSGPKFANRSRQAGQRRGLVFAFSPTSYQQLRNSALRTLALGTIAGLGFLALGGALVRWSLLREKERRSQDRQQHLANLGQLSAVMAHEIRNPLASLKGHAQLLARALPQGEKNRQRADVVVDEAIRLERLTTTLLDFARSSDLDRKPVDVVSLLKRIVKALDATRVSVMGAPSLIAQLDELRMQQVVHNLIQNALQAAPSAEVEVTIESLRDTGIIHIRDHGPGIDTDDLERIFEPFFTRKTQGTGLGLAIAHRFVSLHGGTLTAENAKDGGAIFTIRLPIERS